MSWFRKQKSRAQPSSELTDVPEEDTPWIRAGKSQEDRYVRPQAEKANWRLFAFFNMVIALVAVSGAVYIGSKSKFIPMVVEVDKLGQTLAVKVLNEAPTDVNTEVYREMFDLIENLRTVSTDRDDNNRRLNKGFSRLTGAAYTYVKSELKKAPPNEVGSSKTVQIEVRTALPTTGKSWQIDWEEHSRNLAGEDMGTEYWRATVQYKLEPSDKPSFFSRNPIGLKVPEISWQKVLK